MQMFSGPPRYAGLEDQDHPAHQHCHEHLPQSDSIHSCAHRLQRLPPYVFQPAYSVVCFLFFACAVSRVKLNGK